ncbi:MAG: DUF3821 domain-containing protein [Methanoregula sp.]
MYANYFFLAVVVILAVISPAAGSLTKISAGAPVYIGEQNLDISSGLQGCRVIAWWANGTDTDAPPAKNVTVIKTLDDSNIAFSYTISPEIFSGYTGTWYCEGKKPLRPVFDVVQPELSVRFWDLDNDVDVTGKTIPLTENITYRIDTNLDKALQLRYRPDMTPLDSFYTISLTDPGNKVLSSVYSGSYGREDFHSVILEKNPIISASPYFWKDGSFWNRTSRNKQGDLISPPGTYTVTVNQNLNHMQEMYAGNPPENMKGLLSASASVTFIKPESTPGTAVTTPESTPSVTTTLSPAGTPAATLTYATTPANRTTVPTKTTYAPLPFWVVLTGLGIALVCAARQRK